MSEEDGVPPERDVKDFKFQQLCRFRISDSPSDLPKHKSRLLASSSRYGLVFVGYDTGFKVIKPAELSKIDQANARDRMTVIIDNFPLVADITIQGFVSFISLNADELSLAVVVTRDDLVQAYLYDVRAFADKTTPVQCFMTVRLTNGGATRFEDLAWNPVQPSTLVTVQTDGGISLYDISDKLTIVATIKASSANCVCWSPRGKQLVVGTTDGKLVQYDQELKKKREWVCPDILTRGNYKVVGVIWLSTFEFLTAYIPDSAEPSDQPDIVLIRGSKDGPIRYQNFEDPCFGNGEERERRLLFQVLSKWDMLLACSSNACEISVIGKHQSEKGDWERWNLDDSARAELPLTDNHFDTFPMGVAIDYSSQHPILLGEGSHPPSPILLLLSTDGVLVPYYMMNTYSGAAILTEPPKPLTTAGMRQPRGELETDAARAPISSNTGSGATTGLASTGTGLSTGVATGLTTGPSFQFVNPNATATTKAAVSSFGIPKTTAPSLFGSGPPASFGPGTSFGGLTTTKATPASTNTTSTVASAAPFSFSQGTPTSTSKAATFSFSESLSKNDASSGFNFGGSSTPSGGSSAFSFKTSSSSGATSVFGVPSTTSDNKSNGIFGAAPSTAGTTPTAPAPTSTFGFSVNSTKPTVSFTTSSVSSPSASKTSGSSFANVAPGTQGPVIPPGVQLSGGTRPERPEQTRPPAAQAFPGIGQTQHAQPQQQHAFKGFVTSAQSSTPTVTPQSALGFKGFINPQMSQPTTPTPMPNLTGQAAGVGQPASSQFKAPVQAVETPRSGDSEDTFTKGIMEELAHFEEEMSEFRAQTCNGGVLVGSRSEMHQLRGKVEELTNFSSEIITTTKDQTKEVDEQKSLCLDLFAMVEECRLRESRNTDNKYMHLLKARALDPASLDHLRQLQQQYQVLDQGLRDVDAILDQQWKEHQNRDRNRNKIKAPTTDVMYRVLKSNSSLIRNQKSNLNNLEKKLKELKLYNKTSAWQHSNSSNNESRDLELSTLADSLLDVDDTPKPSLSSTQISNKAPSPEKQARLRDHLARRAVPRIKSTRPENLSMSRIAAVDRRRYDPEETVVAHAPEQNFQKHIAERGSKHYGTSFRQPTGNKMSSGGMNTAGNVGGQMFMPSGQMSALSTIQGKLPMTITGQSGTRDVSRHNMPPLSGNNNLPSKYTFSAPSAVPGGLKNLGHIVVEDITPPSSTGYEEEDEEDDEEDEEDDTYDDDDDDDYEEEEDENGIGFGSQYTMTEQANENILVKGHSTSLPKAVGFNIAQTSGNVNKNLFGSAVTNKSVSGTVATTVSPMVATFGGKPGEFSFSSGTQSQTSFTFGGNAGGSAFAFGGTSKPETGVKTPGVASASTTKSDQSAFSVSATKRPAVAKDTGFNFGGQMAKNTDRPSEEVSTISPLLLEALSEEEVPRVPTSGTAAAGFSFTNPVPQSKPDVSAAGTLKQELGSSQEPKKVFGQSTSIGGSLFRVQTSVALKAGGSSAASTANTAAILSTPASTVSSSFPGFSVSSSTPVFGQTSSAVPSVTTTATGNGLFVKPAVTAPTTLIPGGSIVSGNSASAGVSQISSSTSTPTTSATTGLFGKTEAGVEVTSPEPDTQSPGDVSGQSETSVSAFGQPTQATTGLFGKPTTTSTGGLFGTATSTSTGGLFGTATTSTASTGGLFGTATSTTSTGGLFGTAATSSTNAGSLFGTAPSTTSTDTIFGTTASTTKPGGMFETPSSTTSTGSIFGVTTANSATPAFGASSSATSTTTSLFGGTSASTSASSIFGSAPAVSQSAPIFGSTSASKPLFGSTPTSTTSAPSMFGGTPISTASTGFGGFTSPSFGTSATFPQSNQSSTLFGQAATTQAGFGQSPSQSPFSQTQSSSQNQASGDGGLFSGLGGQPSAEKANTNVFGSPSSFGSSDQPGTASLFGNQTSTGFGTTGSGPNSPSGGAFSGGFAMGGTGVGSSGFGVNQSQGQGFGAAPSFGGSATFGSTLGGFGSPPGFGSGAAFGSAASFSSPVTSASTSPGGTGFAGFASSNSPTFGSLAGSSDTPTFGSMEGGGGGGVGVGGGGFSTTPGFGGGTSAGFGSTSSQGFGNAGTGNNSFGSNPAFSGYR
ncbi:nuclear pore complex protein Nup214-like isoform X2 [Mizuhopecten yessoensis]|uniref:nuclear pore complex protein Nup214-like isoform X2 n=1 Tax=Mizuhopecten yessoensis TaxID=6573 RepID=UPI000B45949B|nr:nuclear pore complex protein Nup214-like isoform X2 [Mizuhopecten yessoensis]